MLPHGFQNIRVAHALRDLSHARREIHIAREALPLAVERRADARFKLVLFASVPAARLFAVRAAVALCFSRLSAAVLRAVLHQLFKRHVAGARRCGVSLRVVRRPSGGVQRRRNRVFKFRHGLSPFAPWASSCLCKRQKCGGYGRIVSCSSGGLCMSAL